MDVGLAGSKAGVACYSSVQDLLSTVWYSLRDAGLQARRGRFFGATWKTVNCSAAGSVGGFLAGTSLAVNGLPQARDRTF